MEHRIGYRPEIDGLRAIAVMSVIFFHAGLAFLPAGFLGVDIFLVISGYLITNILFSDLEAGKFSILRFYERRIRRIAPALMFVILVTLIPAYLLMVPDDLKSFGESVVATIFFSNNILLWISSGYFDLATEFKPLMHTWSLGVEEHYYIGIPLLMWALYRFGRRRATWVGIAAVSTLSFLFCLWAVDRMPLFNFYWIFSRAWELGAGGLIALAEPYLRRRLVIGPGTAGMLSLAGLAMIVVPMAVFARTTPMPSWPTLLPVIGTCLVILFASARDPAGRLLSTRPFVGIGLISYSAYLFHQPIFAFTRIMMLEKPSTELMLALIPVTLVCGYISWRWVEQPFRKKSMPTRRLLRVVGGTSLIAVAAGMALYLTSGFYRNWPELAERDTGFSSHSNIVYNTEPDRYEGNILPPSGSGKTNVMVLGDSYARDFINMGRESGALTDDNSNIGFAHVGDCPGTRLPIPVVENIRRADFVVQGSAFDPERARCISARVTAIRGATKAQIAVIGTKSFGWNDNAIMLLDPSVRYSYRPKPVAEVVKANEEAKRILPPNVYVDVMGMIADADGRVPVFTPGHMFISPDRAHLTRAGARYLGGIIFARHPVLRALATRNAAIAPPMAKPVVAGD